MRTASYDVVETVEHVALDAPVHDLDVERTHNFVANGIVTHNSIYAFRGADIRNILDFEQDFGGADTVALEQNYRSTNAILEAANAVIDNNRDRKPKRLWSELGEGDPVEVVEVEDEHAEARFVAAEIARLVESGYSASEIAVFYRTNAQSRVLEDVLVRQGVPYQVIGGPRFYERAEIKDAVAYLSLLNNPDDAVALMRIANRPRRGIGDTSIQRLVAHADALGISLWEATADPEAAGVATASARAIRGFRTIDRVAHVGGPGARGRRARRAVLAAVGDDRGVRGGAHDRGARPDREPLGARRLRAGVSRRASRSRRSPGSSRRCSSSPTRTRWATTRRRSR